LEEAKIESAVPNLRAPAHVWAAVGDGRCGLGNVERVDGPLPDLDDDALRSPHAPEHKQQAVWKLEQFNVDQVFASVEKLSESPQ
jgi:hypothetical protein